MAKYKPYRFVLYLTARFLASLLWILPRRVLLAVARGLGRAAFYLVPRHRDAVLKNLDKAFGEEMDSSRKKEIARGVFENMAQSAAELLQFDKLSPQRIQSMVDDSHVLDIYRDILAEGKGLISISAHIGNWELLAAIFGVQGFSGKAVARRVRYEPYNRWIEHLRASVGVNLVYRGDSPKEIFNVLKRGELLGMVPDQDIDSLRGIFVDFFGRPAHTTIAPVKIALAAGAPIMTSFMIRIPGDRYRVVLGDLIRPKVETTREEAVKKYTEAWMKSCEKVIRQYPEQWGWMHDRWKTRQITPEK